MTSRLSQGHAPRGAGPERATGDAAAANKQACQTAVNDGLAPSGNDSFEKLAAEFGHEDPVAGGVSPPAQPTSRLWRTTTEPERGSIR